ncbi:MAG: methyltransferase [Solidesulfovibrio sp. DCME]|uniref:methyltransferase n=1 Tax=Solidesulfovibrio sp. DCME TaxID=3447380 RepID=UPI003D09FC96
MERDIALPGVDDRLVWDVWGSAVHLPAVLVADALGIFEALAAQPASREELAARLDLDGQGLAGLLPLLACLGFLAKRLGRFGLTEAGQRYLRRGQPFYWGEALGVMRELPMVGALCRALADKAGPGQFQAAKGWADGRLDQEAAEAAARVMQGQSLAAALGLAASGHFRGVSRLLDVGGGSGCFAIALARRDPALRCTVMDLPAMCQAAAGYLASADLGRRVDTLARDMFRDPWPEDHDAVLLSNVVHDWDEATNRDLAARAFRSLPRGGRVFVHEILLDDDGVGPLAAAALSVLLYLAVGGRQYAAGEVAAFLAKAGFVDIGVHAAHGYFSLVTARKP